MNRTIQVLASVPLIPEYQAVADPGRWYWRRRSIGAAGWLVTFNLRHLAGPAQEFGTRVVRPSDAWGEVRRQEKK